MRIYTSDGFSYEGMDAATVTRLRSELGLTTTFISADEFNALANQK